MKKLSQTLGIKDYREWSVVGQRDLHVGSELARAYFSDQLRALLHDIAVKLFRPFGLTRIGKAGPVALLAVGIERKLRDQEKLSADL